MSSVGLEDYIYTWYESNKKQSYNNIEGKVVQKTRSKKFILLKIKDSLLRFHPEHDEDTSFNPYKPAPNNPTELLEWKNHHVSKNCFMTAMVAFNQYSLLQKMMKKPKYLNTDGNNYATAIVKK